MIWTTLLTNIRSQLDEVSTTGAFWADSELLAWANDGQKDMSRRAEDLQTFDTSVAVSANVAKYSLPTNVIRVHRVEYVQTGDTRTYPLQASTYDEMDAIWGTMQATPTTSPQYYVMWGTPGATGTTALKIQLYPVPSSAGLLNIFYYRLPVDMTVGGSTVDVVAGWEDALVVYVSSRALMKDRNPMWQDYKTLYEQSMANLIDMSRQWHDQSRFVSTNAGFGDGGNIWGWD